MPDYERRPSDLPPELLERIFQLHARSCREPGLDSERLGCSSTTNPYAWIIVTHVCRYWRDVALGSALLWSHIVLTRNLDCIKAFLTRSQQASLTVVQLRPNPGCFGERVMPVAPMRLVLAEMNRIRALELYMKWWIFDDIAEYLAKPAAHLKSLTLSTPHGLYDCGVVQPVLHLDHKYNGPTLERLSLCAYGFPWWNAAPFKALKSFHIEKGIPEKPSVAQVVRALQWMPCLTDLSLEDVFGPSPKHLTSLPAVDDVAVLRQLENIKLSGDIVSCTCLLSSLIFPGTTHIFLDFARKSGSADLTLATIPIYKKLTGSLPDTIIDIGSAPGPPIRVNLTREKSSFLIEGYSPRGSVPPDASVSNLAPSVSIRLPPEPSCLEDICRDLPTESIKVLAISDHFEWRNVAPHLESAEELELAGWSTQEITHLLRHGCDSTIHGESDYTSPCAVAFPSLRFLTISPMDGRCIPDFGKDDDTKVVLEAVNARNRLITNPIMYEYYGHFLAGFWTGIRVNQQWHILEKHFSV
ncbi:hypothetical protein BDY19DRAFT_906598 [Irpex rosettiformis]|uniref:Uncharacterized protein n=1 Tax=Irpex rosettiformis TaxID=378272 RepID=A0ACB8U2R8_9APHY|nr:hypothetical protein BDY19DRAFT_906598 [Irpex rosettiformis]